MERPSGKVKGVQIDHWYKEVREQKSNWRIPEAKRSSGSRVTYDGELRAPEDKVMEDDAEIDSCINGGMVKDCRSIELLLSTGPILSSGVG